MNDMLDFTLIFLKALAWHAAALVALAWLVMLPALGLAWLLGWLA
jgi:hypothetical protein